MLRGAAWREERERREQELAAGNLAAWQTLARLAGQGANSQAANSKAANSQAANKSASHIDAREASEPADVDALIALAATCSENPGTAEVGKLRRLGDASLVHAALQLAKARRKAKTKFSEASELLADPEGIEMSSSTLAAAYKASRFAAARGTRRANASQGATSNADVLNADVLDLCCGIGGDAIECARAGLRVLAIDSDAMRVALCEANLRRLGSAASTSPASFAVVQASAESLLGEVHGVQAHVVQTHLTQAQHALLHIDPSRRTAPTRLQASVRTTTWDELSPPPATLAALLQRWPHAAIKQRAGLELEALPDWLPPCEAEIISEQGSLTQCMLWTGALRSGEAQSFQQSARQAAANAEDFTPAPFRRATLLTASAGSPRSFTAHSLASSRSDAHEQLPVAEVAKFLYEPDDSIERARLLHLLLALAQQEDAATAMPHPRVGLLTSSSLLTGKARPWLRAFEVIAHEPFRPKTLTKLVHSFDAGHVEVKTRAKVVNPDEWQPKLSRKGQGQPLAVFVLRFGEETRAIVTRRVP